MTTPQEEFWKSGFGNEYTQRNSLTPAQMDKLYEERYGLSRTAMNQRFLAGLSITNILEVGANRGVQLLLLQQMGYTNLYGIEINDGAIEASRKTSTGLNIIKASAFDIPFKDSYFDLVFTSGVLIHISPANLPDALREIYRVTKHYIWGFEYFADQHGAIEYRGHTDRLWKGNFAQWYRQVFPNLELVREEKFKYQKEQNVDAMFMLKKAQTL